MFIDSHCHINSEDLRDQAHEVVRRANEAGVKKMIIAGCDLNDSLEAAELAREFDLFASIGIHPHEAKRYSDVPEEFHRLIEDEKVVAVGEIGLDYHYDLSPRDVQIEMFERQLKFAEEKNMPVILHIREAMEDAMKILHNHKNLKNPEERIPFCVKEQNLSSTLRQAQNPPKQQQAGSEHREFRVQAADEDRKKNVDRFTLPY